MESKISAINSPPISSNQEKDLVVKGFTIDLKAGTATKVTEDGYTIKVSYPNGKNDQDKFVKYLNNYDDAALTCVISALRDYKGSKAGLSYTYSNDPAGSTSKTQYINSKGESKIKTVKGYQDQIAQLKKADNPDKVKIKKTQAKLDKLIKLDGLVNVIAQRSLDTDKGAKLNPKGPETPKLATKPELKSVPKTENQPLSQPMKTEKKSPTEKPPGPKNTKNKSNILGNQKSVPTGQLNNVTNAAQTPINPREADSAGNQKLSAEEKQFAQQSNVKDLKEMMEERSLFNNGDISIHCDIQNFQKDYPHVNLQLFQNLGGQGLECTPSNFSSKIDYSSKRDCAIRLHINENHWGLVYIDHKKKTVEFYDSMGGKNYSGLQENLNEAAKKFSESLGGPYTCINKINSDKPLQRDGHQCGPWILYFLENRLKNPDVDFNLIPKNDDTAIIQNHRIGVIKTRIRYEIGDDLGIKIRKSTSYNQASVIFNKAVNENKATVDTYLAYLDACWMYAESSPKAMEKANEIYSQIIKHKDMNANSFTRLMAVCSQYGKSEAADKTYEEAVKAGTVNSHMLKMYIDYSFNNGRMENAEKAFEYALKLDTNIKIDNSLLFLIKYYVQKNYDINNDDEAHRAYQLAIDKFPELPFL